MRISGIRPFPDDHRGLDQGSDPSLATTEVWIQGSDPSLADRRVRTPSLTFPSFRKAVPLRPVLSLTDSFFARGREEHSETNSHDRIRGRDWADLGRVRACAVTCCDG